MDDILQTLVVEHQQKKDNASLEKVIKQLKPFLDAKAHKISRLAKAEFDDIRQELEGYIRRHHNRN